MRENSRMRKISQEHIEDDYLSLFRACHRLLPNIERCIGKRKLIVWGCGRCGVASYDAIQESELEIFSFADKKFQEISSFMGLPVVNPEQLRPKDYYVVVAISTFDVNVEEFLYEHGYTCRDFVQVNDTGFLAKDDLVYKGVLVGRGTYGYKELLKNYPLATRIGRYCSINGTARIWNNHPLGYITTSPLLDHRAFCNYEGYVRRREFCQKYGSYFENHSFENSPLRANQPVEIGNDVWIGANAIILPGVKICDGVVVAAGAVVTHDIEPYAIVGGIPAKLIKKRFDDEMIKKLLKIAWWEWTPEEIEDKLEFFYQPDIFVSRFVTM